jgi:hypothetical protein
MQALPKPVAPLQGAIVAERIVEVSSSLLCKKYKVFCELTNCLIATHVPLIA